MNIEVLLEEINIDIVKLTAINSVQEDSIKKQSQRASLRKIEIYFEAFKNKILALEKKSGLIDRIQLKRDVNSLYKIMKDTETDDRMRAVKTEQYLSKMCAKYRAEISADSIRNASTRENSVNYNEIHNENHTEQSQHLDSSQQFEKRESPMQRRIREYTEYIDGISRDNGPHENVSIRYNLKDNAYYVNGEEVIEGKKRLITIKEKAAYITSRVKDLAEYKYLLDGYMFEESKILKNCDAYVVGILLEKDVKLARDYIRQMSKSSTKKYSKMDYSLTYDIRGIDGPLRGRYSFLERIGIKKMVKQSKDVAKIVEDKKKLPWYASIPFIGALAIAGISGTTAALNSGSQNRNDDARDSYSDTMEPGTTHEDNTQATYTTDYEFTTTETETSTTTHNTTPTTTENHSSNVHEEVEDTIKGGNHDEEEKVVVNIGDKIKVQDGLKYTANCLGGGNSNRIGAVSWRPATEYSIDRVAFVHEGKVLGIMNAGEQDIEKTMNEIAEKNSISTDDISTSVLLSLVPGTGDTGWANISFYDMQQNLSKSVNNQQNNSIDNIDIEIDR